MNTILLKKKRNNADLLWKLVMVVLAVSVTLLIYRKLTLPKTGSTPTKQVEVQFLEMVMELQRGVVSIERQHENIEELSKALNSGRVTTSQLGQNGDYWLHELRRRVDVREAIQSLNRMKTLEAKAKSVSDEEIAEAEKLFKLISPQIGTQYAESEGLQLSPGDLWRISYTISHRGEKPL